MRTKIDLLNMLREYVTEDYGIIIEESLIYGRHKIVKKLEEERDSILEDIKVIKRRKL